MAARKMTYPPFRATGRPLKYTPEQLAEKFAEYVEWANANPIEVGYTEKIKFSKTTRNLEHSETKPRMVSILGFMVWLGTSTRWWGELSDGKQGEIFSELKARVKDYCSHYQTEMASAGIYKENIISRLLGLADRSAVTARGEGVTIVVKSEEEKERIDGMKELEV